MDSSRVESRKFWIPNTVVDRQPCPFSILLQDIEGFLFRLLSFLLFLIFFLIIIIIIILRLLEVTAKKWENIKRRTSPVFQVLPPWRAAKSGSISFKIRTNEPNGLIMYSRSGAHTRVCEFRSIYLYFSSFFKNSIL